ncbi:MAG: DUF6036 family nucleotidyltransferase [Terrimicrobiaceae bacterium]
MRAIANSEKIQTFLHSLAAHVKGEGRIYLVGGSTAVLFGWRSTTIDVDLKAEPEPKGLYEAIAFLKDQLDINVELASPDLFIPPLPEWKERSLFISRIGTIEFFHYDPYSQVLAKIERGHPRDLLDAKEMLARKFVKPEKLRALFLAIQPELLRFPAIDPSSFHQALETFLAEHENPRSPDS